MVPKVGSPVSIARFVHRRRNGLSWSCSTSLAVRNSETYGRPLTRLIAPGTGSRNRAVRAAMSCVSRCSTACR